MHSEGEKSKILQLAEKYAKKGKLKEAIAEYQKFLSENPQDLHVRSLVGDLYLKAGQKGKAVDEFKKMANFYEERGLFSQSLAIYKKINRLGPDQMDIAVKMADLYSNQGFISEAKDKYLQIASKLREAGQKKEAISLYEKVLNLDKEDFESKLIIANLYAKEGSVEEAVEKFNEVAEFMIHKENFRKAREVLDLAKNLKEDDLRTLSNLVQIHKSEDRSQEALDLIQNVLRKDENNLRALSLLGNLYHEKQDFKKAEETFSKIISLNPNDFEARFKLGRIHMDHERLDEAFAQFEPLVDSLLRRQKEKKAVGLLGLILSTKKPHLPTLEKLASIYKSNNQTRNLEIVYRVILEECRRKNLKEKSLAILKDLLSISPLDEKAVAQYRKLSKELGVPDEEEIPSEPSVSIEEAKEIIEENLAKADLYIEQGLIRNARRILEHLRIKFPDEPQIQQKIAALEQFSPEVREEEISQRVEKVTEKETELFGKEARLQKEKERSVAAEGGEEKLTAADIFADTDIIPEISPEEEEKLYYDLEEKIDEELEVLRQTYRKQLKGDTTVVEKELAEILTEFRKDVETKVGKEDYESRFNLGIAYLEQGLIEEAIQEFQLASQDEERAVDCYSAISACFRRKKEFKKAIEWIEKAFLHSEKGSDQHFSLKYEMASVYEEMKEWKKALKLYNKIKKWDPEYLDVVDKIEAIQEKSRR